MTPHPHISSGNSVLGISLHMPLNAFVSRIKSLREKAYECNERKCEFAGLRLFEIQGCIHVFVDTQNARVYRIDLLPDFAGDLIPGVSIGDTYSHLKEKLDNQRILFDDDFVLIDGSTILFEMSEDMTCVTGITRDTSRIEGAIIRYYDEVR